MSTASIPATTTSAQAGVPDASASKQIDHHSAADFLAVLPGSVNQLNCSDFAANNSGIDLSALVHKDQAPARDQQSTQTNSQPQDQRANDVKPAVQPSIQKILEQPSSSASRQTSNKNDSNASANTANDQKNPRDTVSDSQKSDKTSDVNAQDNSTDPQQSQKQLHSALQDELSRLDQILSSIIQLLTPAPIQPQATTGSNTNNNSHNGDVTITAAVGESITTNSGSISILAFATEQFSSLPNVAGNQPQTSATGASGELPLLHDIQSILEQLQQAFQGNVVTPAASAIDWSKITHNTAPDQNLASILSALTLPSASIATPLAANAVPQDTSVALPVAATPTPVDALQNTLDKLAQLLAPTANINQQAAPVVTDAATAPSLPSAPVATATATPAAPKDELVAFIKSGIADVRQQLQKLKGQNEAIFSQVKNDTQALGFNPEALFKDTLSANGLTLKDVATQTPVAYAGVIAAPTQNTPVVQTSAGTQSDTLFANGIALVQQATANSDTSDFSGNQQDNAPAQPVVLAGATQTQSNNATNGAGFSRALQQTSPQPLLEQVSFQVKTALKDGSSKITIQLHPADLGKVDVKLSVDASGKTSVVVTADKQQTLDLLQRDAQGLARALTDAGLSTDSGSLSFNLGGGQNQNSGQNNATQSVSTYQKLQPDDEHETNLSILSRSYIVNVAQGLDIEI